MWSEIRKSSGTPRQEFATVRPAPRFLKGQDLECVCQLGGKEVRGWEWGSWSRGWGNYDGLLLLWVAAAVAVAVAIVGRQDEDEVKTKKQWQTEIEAVAQFHSLRISVQENNAKPSTHPQKPLHSSRRGRKDLTLCTPHHSTPSRNAFSGCGFWALLAPRHCLLFGLAARPQTKQYKFILLPRPHT